MVGLFQGQMQEVTALAPEASTIDHTQIQSNNGCKRLRWRYAIWPAIARSGSDRRCLFALAWLQEVWNCNGSQNQHYSRHDE
jgi:hypothetical protein